MSIYKWLTNREYRYFYRKVQDVQNSIWEYTFKVVKSRSVREGVRMDRDSAIESLNNIEGALKTAPAEEAARLSEKLNAIKENIQRYEAQMKMIDDQINGGLGTQENPAGIGILEQIKSLTELQLMYKDYLSKI